jgi:hypothetical protein
MFNGTPGKIGGTTNLAFMYVSARNLGPAPNSIPALPKPGKLGIAGNCNLGKLGNVVGNPKELAVPDKLGKLGKVAGTPIDVAKLGMLGIPIVGAVIFGNAPATEEFIMLVLVVAATDLAVAAIEETDGALIIGIVGMLIYPSCQKNPATQPTTQLRFPSNYTNLTCLKCL